MRPAFNYLALDEPRQSNLQITNRLNCGKTAEISHKHNLMSVRLAQEL